MSSNPASEAKRRRVDSSSASEDWKGLFLEKCNEYRKISDRLEKERDRLEKERDRLDRERDRVEEMLKEIGDLKAREVLLKEKLCQANNEILETKSTLSARGAVEYFDTTTNHLPRDVRLDPSRVNRFMAIFDRNRTFRHACRRAFGDDVIPRRVAEIVQEVYSNASVDVHYWAKQKGIVVQRSDYTEDQLKVLDCICQSIPCTFTIE